MLQLLVAVPLSIPHSLLSSSPVHSSLSPLILPYPFLTLSSSPLPLIPSPLQLALKHDTARVVQSCIKKGSEEHRAMVLSELKGMDECVCVHVDVHVHVHV